MQDVRQPLVVTEGEAARLLAVSKAALRRWRREGRGPRFTRLERCVRYDLRAIERFLAENSSSASGSRAVCVDSRAEGAP
jgi:predicted site-specific integrase-resolvase